MADLKSKLDSLLGKGKVQFNRDLADLTTLKVAARARYFFEAKTREELILAKRASLATGLEMVIVGGGSNLVFAHQLQDKLIVKNTYRYRKIINQSRKTIDILFSSGYPFSQIVRETIARGYAGFEYHLGLPGSLGGAVYMNSKWTKPLTAVGDNLLRIFLVDKKGRVMEKPKTYLRLSYGYSYLQDDGSLLLEAVFRLKKTTPSLLKQRAATALAYRLQTQPKGVLTSGCFFKNPANLSAGYLIDRAGLKGIRQGAFVVSPSHANFIVNLGGGKGSDLLNLIKLVKKRVYDKFGINLVEEVVIV